MSILNGIKCGLASTAILMGSHAWAGGPTGMATEVTQILNNSELVASVGEQVKTVAELAKQYATQLQQFKEQLLAGAPTQLYQVWTTIDGVRKELASVGRYQESLQRAGSSVSQLQSLLAQRQASAKIANMPFGQYISVQEAIIERGDLRAKQRLNNEVEVIRQVNDDLTFASEQSNALTGTLGVHQAVNVLNKQMNRMVLQNARLLTMLAQERGTEAAEKEAEKNVSREAAKLLEQDYYSKDSAAKSKATSDVTNFRRANPGLFN